MEYLLSTDSLTKRYGRHKAVNSVVARLALAVRVNAASGDYGNLGVFTDVKVVVYQIVDISMCNARRN